MSLKTQVEDWIFCTVYQTLKIAWINPWLFENNLKSDQDGFECFSAAKSFFLTLTNSYCFLFLYFNPLTPGVQQSVTVIHTWTNGRWKLQAWWTPGTNGLKLFWRVSIFSKQCRYICYALRYLAPFVQFKLYKFYVWYQIAQSVSYLEVLVVWKLHHPWISSY